MGWAINPLWTEGTPMSIEYFVDIQKKHPIDIHQAARFVLKDDEVGNDFADSLPDGVDIPFDYVTVSLSLGNRLAWASGTYFDMVKGNSTLLANDEFEYIRFRMVGPDGGSTVLAFSSKTASW